MCRFRRPLGQLGFAQRAKQRHTSMTPSPPGRYRRPPLVAPRAARRHPCGRTCRLSRSRRLPSSARAWLWGPEWRRRAARPAWRASCGRVSGLGRRYRAARFTRKLSGRHRRAPTIGRWADRRSDRSGEVTEHSRAGNTERNVQVVQICGGIHAGRSSGAPRHRSLVNALSNPACMYASTPRQHSEVALAGSANPRAQSIAPAPRYVTTLSQGIAGNVWKPAEILSLACDRLRHEKGRDSRPFCHLSN